MKYVLVFLAILSVSACSKVELASHVAKQVYQSPDIKHKGYFKIGSTYKIAGTRYKPKESYDLVQTGIASWYGPNFHGKMTANGEIFDQNELTAAHKTLQMPSIAKVTNLENGRSIIVRINDRGPYSKGRVLDLSKRSAEVLGFKNKGVAKIKLEVLREPSLEVARLAKNKQSTKGFENALNNGTYQPSVPAVTSAPEQQFQITQPAPDYNPDHIPTIKPQPIEAIPPEGANIATAAPQKPIMIQTGSFSAEENAVKFARKIQNVTQGEIQIENVQLGDKAFFRVQIPAQNMEEAGNMVQRLKMAGFDQNLLIQK